MGAIFRGFLVLYHTSVTEYLLNSFSFKQPCSGDPHFVDEQM